MGRTFVSSLLFLSSTSLALLSGCSSADEDVGPSAQGGQGGGAGGSSAGSGGSSAGSGGSSAGSGGSSAGQGGSAAGQGGSSAGSGGSGTAVSCGEASDCEKLLPETNPKGCAEIACEAGACVFRAKDKDGDGKRSKLCKDAAGEVSVETGNDCDDTDPNRHPGAWDGPEGEGKPSACDGLDNDCSGTADDSVLADGTSCACKPGAVAACSEDSSGKTIVWPLGEPKGACKMGSKTCVADAVTGLGAWGPCTDAAGPSPEVCDGLDNDCDDKVDAADEGVLAPLWYCDGDNDDEVKPDAQPVKSCEPPASGCEGGKWATNLPKTDCDDGRVDVNKKSLEVCDDGGGGPATDENCDGQKNENCSCINGQQQDCFIDPSGQAIPNSGGAAVGACKAGKQTCAGGQWGACTGGKGPALEFCTTLGVDDDCDGDDQDADDQKAWYCDGDGDGFAAFTAQPVTGCAPPTSGCDGPNPVWRQSPPLTDCNDQRADVSKNAPEVCAQDGEDENCDGQKNEGCACDNGLTQACFIDATGQFIPNTEGVPIGACKAGTQTCSGGQWGVCIGGKGPTIELCFNLGTDDDCDGDATEAQDKPTYYCDADSDGFLNADETKVLTLTQCGTVPPVGSNGCAGTWRPQGSPFLDCNEGSKNTNPNSVETCDTKAEDENCNGQKNEGCACVNGTTQSCFTDPSNNPIPNNNGVAIGACKAGTQTCQNGGWGPCLGGKGPAQEICANLGVDDDCDGKTDDADDTKAWLCDGDNDGFAAIGAKPASACNAPTTGCTGPAPTWKQNIPTTDCGDQRADVNKNAPEVCASDNVDENCSGQINEGCGCSNGATQKCFTDPSGNPIPSSNGVAVGACKAGTQTCSGGQWGACIGGQGPALELCANQGVDNDCDGDTTDADDQKGWYCDGDNDGFAAIGAKPTFACNAPTTGCTGPAPTWKQNLLPSDCNDQRADVNKNALEVCASDNVDENCNGQKNENCACTNSSTQPCWKAPDGQDIPNNNGVPVGACKAGTQTCQNGQWGACLGGKGPENEFCTTLGVDNDCDGDAQDAQDKPTYYCDSDGDGFLNTDSALVKTITLCGNAPAPGSNGCLGTNPIWRPQGTPFTDCNDGRADVNPNGTEVCAQDGIDENCNGKTNEGCNCSNGATQKCFIDPNGQPIPNNNGVAVGECVAGTQTCSGGQWGTCLNGKGPVQEICANLGKDNDCDGDTTDADDMSTYSCDGDGDGYLVANTPTTKACITPSGGCPGPNPIWRLSGPSTDCDDGSATSYPGAAEYCGDSVDSNCVGGDSDGYNLGQPCDVGSGQGACKGNGTRQCSSAGSQTVTCSASEPGLGSTSPKAYPALNGSYDWSCDGNVTRMPFKYVNGQFSGLDNAGNYSGDVSSSTLKPQDSFVGFGPMFPGCQAGDYSWMCSGLPQTKCNKTYYVVVGCCEPGGFAGETRVCYDYAKICGGSIKQVDCTWNGSSCYVSATYNTSAACY